METFMKVDKYLLFIVTANFAFTQDLFAVDFDYNVGIGAEYVSNINYAASDEQADTITRLGAGFRLSEQNRFVQSSTTGAIDYYSYADNTNPSTEVLRLDTINSLILSNLDYRINIDDHLAYVPVSASGNDIPANRQQINLFSIGPFVRFHFSAVDYVEIEYRYEEYYDEITTFDSGMENTWLRLGHRLSPVSQLLLNYVNRSINFDDSALVDYKQQDISLRYENTSPITGYYFEVGSTDVDRSNGTTATGNRKRIGIRRSITPTHAMAVHLRDELSTVAQELGNIQISEPGAIPPTPSAVLPDATSDVFRVKGANIEYLVNESLNQLRFSIEYADIDYQLVSSDNTTATYGVEFTHRFSNQSSFQISYSYQLYELVNIARFDHTKGLRALLTYPLTRGWTISTNIGYDDRNSTTPASEYMTYRYGIGITYQTGEI